MDPEFKGGEFLYTVTLSAIPEGVVEVVDIFSWQRGRRWFGV
jgi:hypothetical protein